MRLAERTLAEISERIVFLDIRSRAWMAEWLEYVAEFDRRGAARLRGFSSTATWLAFECAMDGRTTRDHVRVARRLSETPRVAEAFALGQLSYSKVRALCRLPALDDESGLLRVALNMTTSQLELHVRQQRSAASADLDVANRGRARRFVRHFWDRDGSLRFFGTLAADDGAAFVEALETRATMIRGEEGAPCCAPGHARPSMAARRADALVDLATGGGVATQVVLHADMAALACTARGDEPRSGDILYLRDGPAVPSDLARRLTCDARVGVAGLNLGRTTRVVTPAQRRALESLDGRTCAMPGCTRTHGLDAHHLRHWAQGGRTDLDNLALFCGHHHRLFHEEGWSVRRGQGRSLLITCPDGREVRGPTARAPLPRLTAAA